MTQLRRSYSQIKERNTEVIVVGPENKAAFQSFWQEHDLPFIGLPDSTHSVLKLYGQEVNIFKMGRMPAQVLIDMEGTVRFVHYGKSMQDIPSVDQMLALIDSINQEKNAEQKT